jgi:hypothetical protein
VLVAKTEVIDFQPTVRDNEVLIGAVTSRAVNKTALEAAPKPFSALFDNLSAYSGILCK